MPNYKFGFNVYNYTAEDLIDYASESSLNHIEINLTKDHSSPKSFTKERIQNLKSRIQENEIELSFHLPNKINIADNIGILNRKSFKYLTNTIDIAGGLGVKFINCHIGFFFWFPIAKIKRMKALNRFIENTKSILKRCEDNNVVLTIENVTPLPEGSEHYLLGDNLYDFEYIFSKLESDMIKFCLDTGHANMGEGIDKYLEKFADKLYAIHYHDNFGDDDAHLEIGKGNIDWNNFARKINRIDFKGPFISECKNIKPHEAAIKLKNFLSEN